MIVAKGNLNGNVVDKQNLKGKINTSIEYIRIYPEIQAKTVTPTKQIQTVLPDENVYALSQVTINPIPDNYIEPQGQKEITENGTYDVTSFASANVDIEIGKLTNEEYAEANDDLDDILEGSTPITVYPPDWSQLGYSNTPQEVIDDFNYAKQIKDNWDSTQTDLANKFYRDSTLTYMPLVDTSNVTRMSGMFYSCSMLKTVPLLNTSNCANMSTMFRSSPIINIPLFNTSKVVNLSNFVQGCGNLSDESLNNIMGMCINTTSAFTGTKTLAYLGVTSAQATRCQSLSNYQAFLAAGWTTGY